jgi:hypothetical protein
MIFMVSLQWHAFCTKSSLLVFPRWLLPVTYISQQITIRYPGIMHMAPPELLDDPYIQTSDIDILCKDTRS